MTIGVYGGSFDPFHAGHAIVASYVAQFGGVDAVWVLPTPGNPLKQGQYMATDAQRLEMARLATRDFPGVEVSDFEFTLPGPHYTYATLKAMAEHWPQHRFRLIVGGDNWRDFMLWRDPDKILNRFGVIIYPRPGAIADDTIPQVLASGKAMLLEDAPQIMLSASFLREAASKGADISAFLP